MITHDKSVDYFDYPEIVSKDPIAVDVKIADMVHNSDISRIPPEMLGEKNLLRLKRYNSGLKFLAERCFGVKFRF